MNQQVQADSSVASTASRLVPVVILARGAAFLVPVVIAHRFGASGITDSFFYALAVPMTLVVIASNAVSNAATPVLAKVAKTTPADFGRFTGNLSALTAGAAVGLAALLTAVLVPWLPYISEFDDTSRRLVAGFLVALIPFVALVGFRVGLRAAADIQGAHTGVAWGPLVRAVLALAVLFGLHPLLGPYVLPAAFALGAAVEVAWLIAVLSRVGATIKVAGPLDPRLLAGAVAVLPLLGGEAMVALNVLVDKGFAATLQPGSVATLEYADMVRLLPQTLFEAALLPVAFAAWANLSANGRDEQVSVAVDQTLRWVGVLTAPPLAGLFIGRFVLVGWLFERGEFGASDTVAVGTLLGWYIPGLWAMMLGTVAMRAHILAGHTTLILRLGLLSAACNLVLDAWLVQTMGLAGLGLASSVVWVIVPAIYLRALWPGWSLVARGEQWRGVATVALSSLVLAGLSEWFGPPMALFDPMLWAFAVGCFALLGWGVKRTGNPVPSP